MSNKTILDLQPRDQESLESQTTMKLLRHLWDHGEGGLGKKNWMIDLLSLKLRHVTGKLLVSKEFDQLGLLQTKAIYNIAVATFKHN